MPLGKLSHCAIVRELRGESLEVPFLSRLLFFSAIRKINVDLATKKDLPSSLSDEDPLVRWASSNLVAKKRIPAEKELIERLNDPYPEIRQAAHQALVRIARGTDFGPQPLDSQAKVKQAANRWNAWLELQVPLRASAVETPSVSPKR